ncbi:MAG: PAS domain S-box protein [bacterium]|nr:PAS domain S-box protein [bacterium]
MRPPERPALTRYAYGVACVALALAVSLALRAFDLEGFLFLMAVAAAIWFGGGGPGVVAVLLSILALAFFFLAPLRTWSMLPSQVAYCIVFAIFAFILSLLIGQRRRAQLSLLGAHDDLEQRVQERTAELRRANVELRREASERQRAEAEIRRQATLLSLAHDAVLVRDRDHRITYWNRGAEAAYGWTAAEALGQVSHVLLRTTFPISLESIHAITLAQDRWEGEIVHRRRDGSTIVVASRWSLQRDEHGVPTGILEINNDVTDRKRAEEAQRLAEAELARVTRVSTLGEVTASFAHEVNQPLAAIANNANACLGLLPDGPALAEVRDALGDIVHDAERASAIIARVRALATRSTPEKIPLRLTDVTADVVALTAADVAAREVCLDVDADADVPIVCADRVELQQVLLNLLVNGMDAMHATPPSERVLRISIRRDVHHGSPAATVRVADRGAGLGTVQIARLFDAFYTTKSNGMGMGLAICRTIVEAHGGRLWAEANQGPGATFAFTLPAAADAHG